MRKCAKGLKRHIITDTLALVVCREVHKAKVQHRDGSVELVVKLRIEHPSVHKVFADGGYAGLARQGKLDKLDTPNIEVIARKKESVYPFIKTMRC